MCKDLYTMGSKYETITIRKHASMVRFLTRTVVSFCLRLIYFLRLGYFLSLRNFDSTFPIGSLYVPVVFFYSNISLKHKSVIEPNSSNER